MVEIMVVAWKRDDHFLFGNIGSFIFIDLLHLSNTFVMRRVLLPILLFSAMSACKHERELNQDDLQIPSVGYSTPENYSGMKMMWRDEFEGDNLNLSDWKHEIGGNGWGNNELEYYQEKNTTVHDGYLVITAKQENVGGKGYTSSRIITLGKKEFQYGRVDIRALMPKGQGIWPALWMLGSNVSTVGWPACGEIDIMEMIGGPGKDNTVHGTAHWDHAGGHASYGGKLSLDPPKILADEFHVFSIMWTPTAITWYIDDVQFEVIDITPSELSELQNKFYFIFNVAVGGNWPGNPDATTTFPQRMVVDYIRVFQNN